MTVREGTGSYMGRSSNYTFGIWQQASSGQVVFFFLVGGFKSFSTLEAMSLSQTIHALDDRNGMLVEAPWCGVNVVATCHTYGAAFAARLRTEAVVTWGQSLYGGESTGVWCNIAWGEVAISLYHML